MNAAPVRVGDVLAGKYRVDRVLGVGGMGVVVAAHHIQLDDKVAIKFILPEALSNHEAVARFAREARAAVKIKSEHVARVIDVGTMDSGAPYMVMEYLDGCDLSAWLETNTAPKLEQIVELLLQACEALAEAHTYGIVHRDLKPSNLFVIRRPDGTFAVKVLDFGISKVTELTASGTAASMTSTSALLGSPLYMSPEQMRSSKDVDARSDIWSLGVILYELLAGMSPFRAETMPELVVKVMTSDPDPIRDRRPDVPAGVERIICRCLEKERDRRFQSVAELAVALSDFGTPRSKASVERISGVIQTARYSSAPPRDPATPSTAPRAARESAKPASFASPLRDGTAASWGKTSGAARPRRARAVVLGVGAAVLLGGGALVLARLGGRASPGANGEASSANAGSAAQVAPSGEITPPAPAGSAAQAATPGVLPGEQHGEASAAPAAEARADVEPPLPAASAGAKRVGARAPASRRNSTTSMDTYSPAAGAATSAPEHHNPLDIRPQ